MAWVVTPVEDKACPYLWSLTWEGDALAYFQHQWMAEQALDAAVEHIGNPNLYVGTKLSENFQRRVNRIISRTVPCKTCGAKIGSPCKRPSEHATTYENPHEDRRDRMDAYLLSLGD
ncbi:MAG: hypothetical protein CMF52_07565 [Legionellales bacterium]|nr:hypothetical protein [Legionellales bacterium]